MPRRIAALVVLALAAAVAGCAPPTNQTDAALTATGEITALSGGGGGARNACFTCHGLEGRGDGAAAPRLAGLDAGYLHKQMEDYATGLRDDPVMTPIARRLAPHARRKVAVWYASMSPGAVMAPLPAPAAWTRGPESCASCHGARGQGMGPGNPAVAGQPHAYVSSQLRRWKRGQRRNDPRGVMARAAAGLSEAEIEAIAGWLSRPDAVPAPGSGAATTSAAGSAPG